MGKRYRGGFTLIELSLSLIFIAILSLAVVFLIQNLTASYRRGLILNQVNTVGMDLIDDFRISVQNANAEPITKMCERMYPFVQKPGGGSNELDPNSERGKCIADNANSFVSVTRYGKVTLENNGVKSVLDNIPVYGAFCTGTYTYVWNTGYYEEPSVYGDVYKREVVSPGKNTKALIGTKASGTSQVNPKVENFRLVKV